MKQIAVIDNYDSFVYNLVHYLRELTNEFSIDKKQSAQVTVFRNDEVTLEELEKFDKILLSPGGGIPSEAGKLLEIIKHFAPTKDMLGVCLGHQALGEAFGAKLENLSKVYHGIATPINILGEDNLFSDLPKKLDVGRYHSWVIQKDSLPEDFEVTATDEKGEIMAISHKKYKLKGIQFHPESILTPEGKTIIKNWLENVSQTSQSVNK